MHKNTFGFIFMATAALLAASARADSLPSPVPSPAQSTTPFPLPAWVPYLPEDAVADVLSAPMTFVAMVPNPATESSKGCLWKNDKTMLFSGYCNLSVDKQGDVPAVEYLIYSTKGRGLVVLHAESALGKAGGPGDAPTFDKWMVGVSDEPKYADASFNFSSKMDAKSFARAFSNFLDGKPTLQQSQCFSLFGTVTDEDDGTKLYTACDTTVNGVTTKINDAEGPVIAKIENFYSSQYSVWEKLYRAVSKLKH